MFCSSHCTLSFWNWTPLVALFSESFSFFNRSATIEIFKKSFSRRNFYATHCTRDLVLDLDLLYCLFTNTSLTRRRRRQPSVVFCACLIRPDFSRRWLFVAGFVDPPFLYPLKQAGLLHHVSHGLFDVSWVSGQVKADKASILFPKPLPKINGDPAFILNKCFGISDWH